VAVTSLSAAHTVFQGHEEPGPVVTDQFTVDDPIHATARVES
tara:strand:+ start:94 stop:219 length:126 start_codon:yes stop_codon:yes gene_type:complete